MALLSAVSFALAVSGLSDQTGLTAPLSSAAAEKVEQTTISIRQGGSIIGRAVIVSPQGLAITTGEVAFGDDGLPKTNLQAVRGAETIGTISIAGFDSVTDLALIKFTASGVPFATVAKEDSNRVVMASLAAGMVRAEVSRRGVVGVMQLTQRFVPLVELRMEGGAIVMGGAPVFSPDGQLVGILQASLTADQNKASADEMGGIAAKSLVQPTLGPRTAVTGYTISLPVLRRVVEGFTSGEQIVRHPYIGMYFGNYNGGGALVGDVTKGGPSDAAGLVKGDVIVQAGDRPIITAVDFASFLFDVKIGDTIALTVRRAYQEFVAKVNVIADPNAVSGTKLVRKSVRR
jgi:S1-C subfamily serine protease